MNLYLELGRHHPKAKESFTFERLDAFHDEAVLSAIYGKAWHSVLVTSADNAFLHTFVPQPIEGEALCDIEPWLGYAGPVMLRPDEHFALHAVGHYRGLCRDVEVVAEVIRFNPLLENHGGWGDAIGVFPAKEIVIVDCFEDEERQGAEFTKSCRYMIRKGIESGCRFVRLDRERDWSAFTELYDDSIIRVGADPRWRFDPLFFERVRSCERFAIYGVLQGDRLVSASLVIEHPGGWYYFLAANARDMAAGANELLVAGIARAAASNGVPHLILGGGNTTASDDPLFRFKKKFSPVARTFHMGKLVHNPEAFHRLCGQAIARKPEIAESGFFLKYRL